MKIRISNAIQLDWLCRAPEGMPYERLMYSCHAGNALIVEISDEERAEIIADCKHQGNIGGNYIDPVSAGLTRAYRALHKQAKAKAQIEAKSREAA